MLSVMHLPLAHLIRMYTPPDSVNIKLQKCEAYEVVKLSKQRVTMNDNPAYGEIGVGTR